MQLHKIVLACSCACGGLAALMGHTAGHIGAQSCAHVAWLL